MSEQKSQVMSPSGEVVLPHQNTIDLSNRGICDSCQQKVIEAIQGKPPTPKFNTKVDPFIRDRDEFIEKTCKEIIEKRHEILDLFCKTFLACQDAPTLEAMRSFFDLIELEMVMNSDVSQSFRIKMRSK